MYHKPLAGEAIHLQEMPRALPLRALLPFAVLLAFGLVAAAVAVPVLADDDDDDERESRKGKGARGNYEKGLEDRIREALNPYPPAQGAPPQPPPPKPAPAPTPSPAPTNSRDGDAGSALRLALSPKPAPVEEASAVEGPVHAATPGGFVALLRTAWEMTPRAATLAVLGILLALAGRSVVRAARRPAAVEPAAVEAPGGPPPVRRSEPEVLASLAAAGLGSARVRGMSPGERLVELTAPAGECRCREAAEALREGYAALKEVDVEVASRACGVEGPEKERVCLVGLRWSDEGFRRQRDFPG